MLRRFFVFISVFFCFINLYGQSKEGSLSGILFSVENPDMMDGSDKILSGTVVRLVLGKDTLNTVASDNKFTFSNLPLGKAKLIISHVIYETKVMDVDIKRKTLISVALKEKVNTLNEVKVKATIPMMTRNGDTIKFNAAAVKLLEGDESLEILKQMPGVEISDSGIKIFGQNIAKTYVNSRLIFGRDKMAALENIPAGDVISIRTYEEAVEKDTDERRDPENKKIRVIDIKTKKPILSSTTANALLSYGHDFGQSGKNRYSAGVGANFFSEELMLSASILSNNINRSSNRMRDIISSGALSGYKENSSVSLGLERNWAKKLLMDNISLEAAYRYDKSYSKNGNIQQMVYFPTSDYSSRENSDSSSSRTNSTSQSLSLNLRATKKHFGQINASSQFQKTDSRSVSERSGMISQDESVIYNKSANNNNTDGYRLSQNIGMHSNWKRILLSLSMNYSSSNNDGRGFRIDSLASTGLKKIIESGPVGISNNLGINGRLSYKLHEKGNNNINDNIYVGYNFSHSKESRKRFSTNITDIHEQLVDTLNTYDYSINQDTHDGVLGAYISAGESININFALKCRATGINRDETFPESQNYDKYQTAILPIITFNKKLEGMDNIQLSYNTNSIMPSLEQLRNNLNDQNPYSLIAGNPALKQSYVHSFNLSVYIVNKEFKAFNVDASLQMTNNKIANKTRYFSEDTSLPDWGGYIAVAKSTLTEYKNLNGKISGSLSAGLSLPLQSIKSTFDISTAFMFDKDPSYIQDKLLSTTNLSTNLNLSFYSNFSRSIRVRMYTNLGYNYSDNSSGLDTKMLHLSSNISTELQLFKKVYMNTNYTASLYKDLSADHANTDQHLLNAVVGLKFLKGKFDISLAAYDILNRNTGYDRIVVEDYIRNRWNQSFGRCFSFNLAYKFYKSNSPSRMAPDLDWNNNI